MGNPLSRAFDALTAAGVPSLLNIGYESKFNQGTAGFTPYFSTCQGSILGTYFGANMSAVHESRVSLFGDELAVVLLLFSMHHSEGYINLFSHIDPAKSE